MGVHLHTHDHDHDHDHEGGHAPRALTAALVVTIIFMLIEFAGGWFANSLALISDGAHMLTDVGAVLLSLFALWFSRRPSTPQMTFGYHRAEILGALASGLVIWLLAGVLLYEAILRIGAPPEVKGPIVVVVAAIGLAANLLSMRMLHSAREENLNVRAAYLHVVADSLGSVGALIAGLVLWTTGWRPIDPITTILVAILMLVSSWSLMKESVGVLMEMAPPGVDASQIRRNLSELPGVNEVHDLHVWRVSSNRLALSVHLITENSEQVLGSAHDMLKAKYGIEHTTIQIEDPKKFRSDRCYDCAQ